MLNAQSAGDRAAAADASVHSAFGIRHWALGIDSWRWVVAIQRPMAGTRYDEARPCGVPAHRLQFCAEHRPPVEDSMHCRVWIVTTCAAALLFANVPAAEAQVGYFGQNKVQYRDLNFRV